MEFGLCVHVFCGVRGRVPNIESFSVCGFLWGLNGDGALVVCVAAKVHLHCESF